MTRSIIFNCLITFIFPVLAPEEFVEQKLSSFTFQEDSSTDSNILVKHLQEELRNYVSLVAHACCLYLALLVLHFIMNIPCRVTSHKNIGPSDDLPHSSTYIYSHIKKSLMLLSSI